MIDAWGGNSPYTSPMLAQILEMKESREIVVHYYFTCY
jgi:hypothetical protein